MKIIHCIAFYLLVGNICNSQILKKVLKDAKNTTESKVRSKAIQKTDQAIDSLLTPKQKIDTKSKEKNNTSNTGAKQGTTTGSSSSSGSEGGDGMAVGEGFIQMSVSADKVFKGGMVLVTGSSVKYGELKNIEFHVKGPATEDTDKIDLAENGTYTVGWTAEYPGEYTLTVKSSDGKDKRSEKVLVYDLEVIDSFLVMENIEWTHKTYDKLTNEAERLRIILAAVMMQSLIKK